MKEMKMNKFLEDNVLGLPETTLMNVKLDDIVIVRTDSSYTMPLAEELGRQVKQLLPNNKVMIIPNNVEILVLPAQAEVISVGVK
jgi:hypothetical protein